MRKKEREEKKKKKRNMKNCSSMLGRDKVWAECSLSFSSFKRLKPYALSRMEMRYHKTRSPGGCKDVDVGFDKGI